MPHLLAMLMFLGLGPIPGAPPSAAPSSGALHSRVPVEFVRSLERAVARGELTITDQLRLRRLAITAPGRLPPVWRERLAAAPVPAWAATAVLVENFQWSARMGLRDDSQFPPLGSFLDSGTFPIRVVYSLESDLELAQAVLVAAEAAWQKEIVEWGFFAPPVGTSEGRYRIYVDDTGMGGGGYMAPVDFFWDTAWDDCTSYVVIDRLNSTGDAGPVVAHELSHATQGAMDCLETITFWENTSTFIMAEVDPVGRGWQDGFLPYFQDYPQESVAGGSYEDPELGYFWYGGFLWPNFLGGLYGGQEEPAVLVRRIWEGAMQESGGNANEISYMTSIDEVLATRAQASLDVAFAHFAVSRFLVGENSMAPAADMPHASDYTSVPPIAADLVVDMPDVFTPVASRRPEPYAVNYLTLSRPEDFSREVTLRLSTEDSAGWIAVLFSTKGSEVLEAPVVGGVATLRFAMGEDRVRHLAVVRLGTPGFHSDEAMSGASYTVEVGPTHPAPVILSVSPETITAGVTSQLTITGDHFVEGATVQFSPYLFDPDAVTFVDAQTLNVTVTPGVDTGLNKISVMVTNPDTGSDVLEEAFSIEAPPNKKKSGCSTGGAPAPVSGFFLLLTVMILRRKRLV
ncbi:IPT/TIG domain-containing protein [Myxococcota bacterium]|nr:IPT/TIG domain-containing protein [Myxococcota bacterium]MBU1412974.1 IPT/TIG domain-containing protein [Myxococcota bacterium]MBU1511581.1 IPT/TIG domain-containing protein [Myxococcota bacterium]